jgi:glutathione S-transferase/GST-like protein
MLELYHWEPNTYFLKPLIALKEKQVAFTSRWFDASAGEQFAPAFPRSTESTLQLEREGPVLVHDGAIIASSFFMLEYIAEAFPGADLYPGDAFQHYRAQAWGQVLTGLGADVSLLGSVRYMVPALRKQDPMELKARLAGIEPVERRLAWTALAEDQHDEQTLSAARERLRFSLARVERGLGESTWLAGPRYSIADIDAFSLLVSLPALTPELVNERDTPRIVIFLARMRNRTAVKESLGLTRTGRPEEAFVPGAEASRWG